VVRNAGTSPEYEPPWEDIWASSTTVGLPRLLQTTRHAGFVSVGCFSITFPNGLEGMSTIHIHPFQTVCSNIRLTSRTSAIPSHQQNDSPWRAAFPNDGVRRKQRSEAEAQGSHHAGVHHGVKGQMTGNYLNGIKHSRPERLHARKQDNNTGHNKHIFIHLFLMSGYQPQ